MMKYNNINKIKFEPKPIPISAEYRPMYKIALIIMVLKLNSRNQTASLLKLHLFSWILKSDENQTKIKNLIKTNFKNGINVWSIEPHLNRALIIAEEEKIIKLENGKYSLIEKGELLYDKIDKDDTIFENEKSILSFIRQKISEQKIERIAKNWL